jgi:parvulin-like peptidyl-prolyl isomerase
MIRIFIFGLFLQFTLHAGLINAIAITVNDDAITLVDIDNTMQTKKVSKDQAVALLVDEILYKQELRKYNIRVDQFDIDGYMEKLAQNNNMSLYAFKNALSQQQDYKQFEEQIKKQLRHQKLISTIAANKITNASDEDIKIYYDNNPNEFEYFNKYDVIHYTTRDKNTLENIKRNPMMAQNGVNVVNTTLELTKVTPQTRYILTQTEQGQYSAIFAENGSYHLFYVSNKNEKTVLEYENVKEKIYSHLMQTRQEQFLKNYFEGLKVTAKINILR